MTMISGISAAMGAVNTAVEQFDRAIITTVTTVDDPNGTLSGEVQVPDGLAGMDTARLAVQAAIAAANASISMLDEVLKLAEYGGQSDSEKSSSEQGASRPADDSSPSLQLLAFFQSMQAQDSAKPAAPSAPAASVAPQGNQGK